MENKYFTPDIEDVHVGYECEEHTPYSKDDWTKVIIEDFGPEADFDLQRCRDFIFMDKIRVPYLTEEQIEAEGWKFDRNQDDDAISFEKKIKNKLYMLHFYPMKNQIIINDINSESLPLNCKDINTFKKICKLLGI